MRALQRTTSCLWIALFACACSAHPPAQLARTHAAHATCAGRKKPDKSHHKPHARKQKSEAPAPPEPSEFERPEEPLSAPPAFNQQPEPPPSAAEEPEPSAAEEPEPDVLETPSIPEPAEPAADGGERLRLRIAPAGGAGARHLELPTRPGTRELDTGLIAALGVGVSVRGMLGSQWLLAAEAQYRTLVGLKAGLVSSQDTSVRSHSLGLAIGPGYRFGERGSVELRFMLGWALRGLRPVTELSLPSVSFHGPLLRPELHIPLAGELITIRIAPELIFPLGISTTLPTGASGFAQSGLGIGGELSLDVRLAEPLYLGIEYRESRVHVATSWGADLFDLERFATARVVLQY
jgi:hypothetical protein